MTDTATKNKAEKKEKKFDLQKDFFATLQPKKRVLRKDAKLLMKDTKQLFNYVEVHQLSKLVPGKVYLKYISKNDSHVYDLGIEDYDSLVKRAGILISGGCWLGKKYHALDDDDWTNWTHIKTKIEYRDDNGHLQRHFLTFKIANYRFFSRPF